jgi:hypothetical protein
MVDTIDHVRLCGVGLMMANNKRRAEKRAEREKQYELEDAIRRAEEHRRSELTMWERIEEADTPERIKEVLHMIATHCGAEK